MTFQNVRLKIASPTLKLKAALRLNASIIGANFIKVSQSSGIFTVDADYTLLGVAPVSNPILGMVAIYDLNTNSYKLNSISDLVATAKTVRTITTAGPQAALTTDDVLIIKQAVGAPFNLTVDWSKRTRSLRVVDGKGDAYTNNITITPKSGQTQLAIADYVYTINGNGASVTLTPLPDGSGAY